MPTRTLAFPATTDPLTNPSHAALHADHAGGWLGYAEVTASQGSITTEVDLTNLTVTVTVGTSRRIRISCELAFSSTVADDRVGVEIKESTTYLRQSSSTLPTTNNQSVWTSVVLTPSSGSHTYKLAATRRNGTGTLTMNSSATLPAYILVEDIGPA